MPARRRMPVPFAVLLCLMFIAPVMGAPSGTQDKPDDNDRKQKAAEVYNTGVKHMQDAREKASQDDSAFAYDYRATSDAKAQQAFERAARDFKKAVELYPEMAEAWNNLGYVQRKLGNLEASLAAYNKAIELDEDFTQAREYRGETYLALGKLEKAQEDLDWLKKMESPYADTLAASIELYRLKEIDTKMKKQ